MEKILDQLNNYNKIANHYITANNVIDYKSIVEKSLEYEINAWKEPLFAFDIAYGNIEIECLLMSLLGLALDEVITHIVSMNVANATDSEIWISLIKSFLQNNKNKEYFVSSTETFTLFDSLIEHIKRIFYFIDRNKYSDLDGHERTECIAVDVIDLVHYMLCECAASNHKLDTRQYSYR